jgi:DNA mismatch endonuclease (patch repair protein)
MPSALHKILPRKKRLALTRSQMMARIRSENTRPEIVTRAAVHALGFRFRKHVRSLPGKPDLANKTNRWAIFVHGCFWHSHAGCKLASDPNSNREYWAEKLQRNRTRDTDRITALRAIGFRVLVIWECDVRDGARLQRSLRKFFRAEIGRRRVKVSGIRSCNSKKKYAESIAYKDRCMTFQ